MEDILREKVETILSLLSKELQDRDIVLIDQAMIENQSLLVYLEKSKHENIYTNGALTEHSSSFLSYEKYIKLFYKNFQGDWVIKVTELKEILNDFKQKIKV